MRRTLWRRIMAAGHGWPWILAMKGCLRIVMADIVYKFNAATQAAIWSLSCENLLGMLHTYPIAFPTSPCHSCHRTWLRQGNSGCSSESGVAGKMPHLADFLIVQRAAGVCGWKSMAWKRNWALGVHRSCVPPYAYTYGVEVCLCIHKMIVT